ncbi:bifunctional ADP-dependent (S)-NAD(P)H-hydrate dehydratase/NAD(P)H-hydrate epimerase [Rhodoferax koreense]|uniref:Bifunctional NAD(P)H-hydrate repair enzyme n=1 Tax=Rhodoferax koreensis TaxID=1842727 RepID=A0A1P8JZL4_9BURK|nr:bifunctional ADP-dependent NAD(P)H-hydrate dehydratase/NAD(P)H-hydrate epimerase [Rhodoferax koreense]APW39186.1 bifunctional ADP-dependent (S)-NAD(P)H-hydrate dehydratase/NAD(P)H-hydrate epimerase [Rhodoferax koreense]
MQRIDATSAQPLFGTAATRRIEQAAMSMLPPHTLMQRAGLAVARLALALAPNAGRIWIACGPGNNGGDGLEAALHLHQWGKAVVVTWLGDEAHAPADARASLLRARGAGVVLAAEAPPRLDTQDLAIDALLGLGSRRAPEGRMAEWIARMNSGPAPVLAVDLPTGLNTDTGAAASPTVQARHTLSLLTLKPGLFTAGGRDAAGQVWLDTLGVVAAEPATAILGGPPAPRPRAHASHKGSYGDVAIVGGAPGMTGAALLAASAALHGGAGRVLVGLLDDRPAAAGIAAALGATHPELMLRAVSALDVARQTVVCGCGGGQAVAAVLPRLLAEAPRMVIDADALNAIAADAALQTQLRARGDRAQFTVMTPHPLEAARLLGIDTGTLQADRLDAARRLAERFGCVVLLKGSGSVIAAPDAPPVINSTGNALLATAGTGDVLAGFTGALLAAGHTAFGAACSAAYLHGLAADSWPADTTLTAGALAARLHVP